MKHVLITGGAGFIGCAISKAIADKAETVIAFDNMHPQVHASSDRPAALDERVELVVGDVTDPDAWDALLGSDGRGFRPDVIIHLAAETGTGQSLTEASRHGSVNVVGTTQLLDALGRHEALPKRIVLTSSRAVYGEGGWRTADGELTYPGQRDAAQLGRSEWDFPGAEPTAMRAAETRPAPASVYAATKLAQEHVLNVWARSVGVDAFILRLQNVYGPGQSLSNPYTGILSLFCRMADAGRSIPLYEDGAVRRDFVLIDDVARAVVLAADFDGAAPADAIDIGSGEFQTIHTAATLIAERYEAPEPKVTGQYRQGDVRHAWADVTAAREVLGWEPQYDLRAGVTRLADWIGTQELPPLD